MEVEQRQSPLVTSDGTNNEENARKRSYIACERCHGQKIKCISQGKDVPCRNCQQSRKKVVCVFPVRDRKVVVQESDLENLKAEIVSLKRKRSQESHGSSARSNTSSHRQSLPPLYPFEHLPNSENSNQAHSCTYSQTHNGMRDFSDLSEDGGMQIIPDETAIQPVYRGEASPETFGSRLVQFIKRDERQPRPRSYSYYKNPKLLRISSTDCNLPNKNYAKLLVRAVLRFVGGDHHLLLRKSFLERLEDTYNLEVYDDPVWLCRLFTVLALGELYSRGGTTKKGTGVPGTGFFMRAMGLFQDMHEEPTVSYIETLLLLSFYLITLNRRTTAYTYAGLALRLSLTLGLHRKIPEGSMSAPEREHRVRVWWTCYALDRIFTSKVGLPIMLRDEDIDVQMPSMDGLTPEEAEDFYPPELMNAQIRLASITGNIMSDLYRIPQPGRANHFVQSVQRILTSLRTWHETLPVVLKLDYGAMPIYPSRSVASLHLHFGNAVIQTTRPILFHLFRSKFEITPTSPPPVVDKTAIALGEACVQAAKTSSSMLAQLWVDGCLAQYGFFDSFSVFSSTMILMMSSAMNGLNDDDDIETAWSLLKFMKDGGNVPASGYYDQLVELKAALDLLKHKITHQPSMTLLNPDLHPSASGVDLLLEASTQPPPLSQNYAHALSPLSMPAFGVGDNIGAALDGPFLQEFLQGSYENWAPQGFDSVGGGGSGMTGAGSAGGYGFGWENANLFGSF